MESHSECGIEPPGSMELVNGRQIVSFKEHVRENTNVLFECQLVRCNCFPSVSKLLSVADKKHLATNPNESSRYDVLINGFLL